MCYVYLFTYFGKLTSISTNVIPMKILEGEGVNKPPL